MILATREERSGLHFRPGGLFMSLTIFGGFNKVSFIRLSFRIKHAYSPGFAAVNKSIRFGWDNETISGFESVLGKHAFGRVSATNCRSTLEVDSNLCKLQTSQLAVQLS
jgi:hypothetical protein